MIYEIDYAFCAISAFVFKHFLAFAGFLLLAYLIFKYFIQKLSNISVILYLLFVISIIVGGIVLSFIPSKEDVLCPTVINSYYLGPVSFILLITFIISTIIDLIMILRMDKEEQKEVFKKVKKTKKKKKKE